MKVVWAVLMTLALLLIELYLVVYLVVFLFFNQLNALLVGSVMVGLAVAYTLLIKVLLKEV